MTDGPGFQPAQPAEPRQRPLDAPSGLFPQIGRQPPRRGGPFIGGADRSAVAAAAIGLLSTTLALAGCCYLGPRLVAVAGGLVAIVLGAITQRRISASEGQLVGTPQVAIGIASGSVAIFLSLLTIFVYFLN
jgi:hypothetical protein